jgi:glycosyltransferase involved in cell wall biosynthesis
MNILLLTKVYASADMQKAETPLVHFFAKAWVKMGHRVMVFVNYPLFPIFVDILIGVFEKRLTSIFGAIPPRRCQTLHYSKEGVDIYRFPMKKVKPHGPYSQQSIEHQLGLITDTLKRNEFVPDVAIGHWWNPQLPLLCKIKEEYKCPTALVLHSDIAATSHYKKYFEGIDYWGFRSKSLLHEFELQFGKASNSFICYSGIPKEFVDKNVSPKSIEGKLSRFIFCGQLIKRKYPAEIIVSLAKVYSKDDSFSLDYVGEGSEEKRISDNIKRYGFSNQIKLWGRIPREEVKNLMNQCECFIMISKDEAYGLVYLEAMSAGCLVIASKGEGFDGIIEHGKNGFLCQAGNIDELTKIIKEINEMSLDQRRVISKRAIMTAEIFTDDKVAKKYLDDIVR